VGSCLMDAEFRCGLVKVLEMDSSDTCRTNILNATKVYMIKVLYVCVKVE
jgi:hypothetical protein